ncbi:MAG: hypothetical protein ONB44_18750 [candidate division KSB1 bacterium]|nr:hypothetical protein [candidate division KSB1 bacterium]MDZ7304170.1 hypothetical protein [candidate division KSB1 bacterium]MDZ7310642.1 hypothetical protein [candidate division KSB1 bacterium]
MRQAHVNFRDSCPQKKMGCDDFLVFAKTSWKILSLGKTPPGMDYLQIFAVKTPSHFEPQDMTQDRVRRAKYFFVMLKHLPLHTYLASNGKIPPDAVLAE